jgi:cytochrome c oxidase subunit 2
MGGWVVAQDPAEHQQWLSARADRSLALRGRQQFLRFQCISCHTGEANARAPVLEGIYMQRRAMQDGSAAVADESYLRESILNPRAKVAAGFQPIMPTYQGQMNEEELLELIAYLKSLRRGDIPPRNENTEPPAVAPDAPQAPADKAKAQEKAK